MYEEEYGSSQDAETDCCRSRGLSALLCWCLSVLILIGLAASIILTVFFIFKSRTFIGKTTESGTIIASTGEDDEDANILTTTLNTIDDLDLLLGIVDAHNNHDDIILETESSSEIHDFVVPTPKTSKPFTSTRSTTTRRTTTTESFLNNHNYNYNNRNPLPSSSSVTPVIHYKSVVVQPQNPISSKSQPSTTTSRKVYNDLVRSTTQNYNYNGHSGGSTSYPKSTSTGSSAPVRITIPTSTSVSSSQEKESQTTMKPLILDTMNSFQEGGNAEEDTSILSRDIIEQLKSMNSNVTRGKNNNYGGGDDLIRESNESLEKLITRIISTASASSEEKKKLTLNDDLITSSTPSSRSHFTQSSSPVTTIGSVGSVAAINVSDRPKHQQNHFDEYYRVSPTIKNGIEINNGPVRATSFQREDLLSRIIKNLAPKFKTKPDQTTSSSITKNSSKEKRITQKPNHDIIIITPSVIVPTSTAETKLSNDRNHSKGSGIEIVKAPNFSWTSSTSSTRPHTNESTTEQQFLDILVGSQDSKTLITKETDDGIVTSVILPPWYENDTFDDHYSTSTTNPYNSISRGSTTTQLAIPNDNEDQNSNENSEDYSSAIATTTYAPPSLGNLFRNLFFNTPLHEKESPHQNFTTTKLPKSRSSTKKPTKNNYSGGISVKGEFSTFSPVKRRLKSTTTVTTPITVKAANEGFHKVSSDGKTNIYGYYPQSDEIMHFSDSARVSILDSSQEVGDDMNTSPSHVIDIEYDRKTQPEIIIDSTDEDIEEDRHHNDGDFLYGGYLSNHDEIAAGSSVRPQVVPPPPEMSFPEPVMDSPLPTGGGIRYPMGLFGEGEPSSKIEHDLLNEGINMVAEAQQEKPIDITPKSILAINRSVENVTTTIPNDKNDSKESEKETAGKQQQEEEADYDQIHLPMQTNSSSEDINRQPIQQLDETLYPFHQIAKPKPADSEQEFDNSFEDAVNTKLEPYSHKPESEESSTRGVYQVFAVKYTTTEKPEVSETNTGIADTSGAQPAKIINDFRAPEAINFHSNTMSFSPSLTTGGFIPSGGYSAETWRPLAYENDHSLPSSQQAASNVKIPREQLYKVPRTSTQRAYTPQIFPNSNQHYLPTHPVKPLHALSKIPFFNNFGNKVVLPNDNRDGDANAIASNLWIQTTENPPSLSPPSKLPIRPSQPIPPPPTPVQYNQNNQQNLKFPTGNSNDNAEHLFHHQNNIIDRKKYSHRPAPPPILMRRTPQAVNNAPPYFNNERNQLQRKVSTPSYAPQYLSNQQQLLRQQQHMHQHMTRIKNQGNHRGHIPWPINGSINDYEQNQQQNQPYDERIHGYHNPNRRKG